MKTGRFFNKSPRRIALLLLMAGCMLSDPVGSVASGTDPQATSGDSHRKATAPNQNLVTTHFSQPMFLNYRLAHCLRPGEECGEPTAHAWCRRMGFDHAGDWEVEKGIGARSPTLTLQEQWDCDQASCDGFAWITCEP
jgi:hypothetical protein